MSTFSLTTQAYIHLHLSGILELEFSKEVTLSMHVQALCRCLYILALVPQN